MLKSSIFQLKLHINPGCPSDICDANKGLINLAHVTADSASDRLHHIWSFVGKPTLLVALAGLNSSVQIDWDSFVGFTNESVRSVKINPPPEFAMVIVLNRFFQFNDLEEKGNFVNVQDKDLVAYDTSLFAYNFSKSVELDDFVEFKVRATKFNDSSIGGGINLTVQTYGDFDHGWNYPHLLHNSNGTQLDIVFDKFKVRKAFKAPRFAVELAFMTSDSKLTNNSFRMSRRRTLDDEHTPGIFELDNLQSQSGYFEFRPVAYTHPERDVSTSTDTHFGPLMCPQDMWFESSLAFAYFGYSQNHLVQAANISFGMTNDGFYTKSNYTSFTFLMGLGVPPTEELSKFVVTVALVGVGIPIIMLLVGVSCICLKRVRTYRRLMEDTNH